MPWDELIKVAPEIIGKAAQSPLGILALMVSIMGTLAIRFFEQAPVGVRVSIFVLVFAGVGAFAFAVVREIPTTSPPPPPPPAPVDVSGDWEGQGPTQDEDVRRNFQYVYFPPGNMRFSFLAHGTALGGTLRLRNRYYRAFDTEYGLLDGRIDGHRVSFNVRSEFKVDDAPMAANERFSGDVDGDRIRFTVQEDTGYPPLQFTAVRRPAAPAPAPAN